MLCEHRRLLGVYNYFYMAEVGKNLNFSEQSAH